MSPGYRMPNTPVKPGEAVKPEDTHSITALIAYRPRKIAVWTAAGN